MRYKANNGCFHMDIDQRAGRAKSRNGSVVNTEAATL